MHDDHRMPWQARRSFLSLLVLGAASRGAVAADLAASGPITLIVPASPGGSADRVGRITAGALSRILEVPVEVDNIPGDGGVIAMNALAAAPNDGSVLGLATSTAIVGGKLLSKGVRFNPLEDFDWLAILGIYPNAMVVGPQSPARSIDEWLQLAQRASPPLTYASAASGSAGHLAGAYLRTEKRAQLSHTVAENLNDGYKLLGEGFIDVLFDGVPNALAEVPRRECRVLAVTSAKRVDGFPDAPSFGELWQRPFEIFVGLAAPKNLARSAHFRLAPAIGVLVSEPVHGNTLRAAGLAFLGMSGAGVRAYVENEFLRNAKLIAMLNDEGIRK